jgi:hypothetical protein
MVLSLVSSLSLCHAAVDVPRRALDVPLAAKTDKVEKKAAAGPADAARKLVADLRYEEAVVEYQRWLADPDQPVNDRATVLFELGFLHTLLGDTVMGRQRGLEALELVPDLALPQGAPQKQADFLAATKALVAQQVRLDVVPRGDKDAPSLVRVSLTDPGKRSHRVVLRHALAASGPYFESPMTCQGTRCAGVVPAPKGADSFNAWYYVEALDASGNTLSRAASPQSPLQVAVVGLNPWYANPWVWGGAGAALVAAAAVFFVVSAQ